MISDRHAVVMLVSAIVGFGCFYLYPLLGPLLFWRNMGGPGKGVAGPFGEGMPQIPPSTEEQQRRLLTEDLIAQQLQNISGTQSMQGLIGGQSLPYPYSQGYPTPDRQSYVGGSEFRVPFQYETKPPEQVSVAPIPGPMDAIVNNRPRKMRIKE